jgi:hypothetical protein
MLPFLVAAACTTNNRYYFDGRFYDGVSGQRLTDYKLQLQFLDQTQNGNIDKDGRYFVGPLPPFQDYTVKVDAMGYRSFLSHNAFQLDPTPMLDRSFYFDGYLFPVGVLSPAVTFNVTLSDSMDLPSGTITLRPTTVSSFYDTPAKMPAGVPTQVWANDDDLQFATVEKMFTDGKVTFAEGELIYGVTYAVTIFGVPGHVIGTGAYVSGTSAEPTFTLTPFTTPALTLAFSSALPGVLDPTGQLILAFSQPIELDPTILQTTYQSAVEAGFTITSPDKNMNGIINTVKAPLMPPGQIGLSFMVTGNRLTFTWNPTMTLATTDAADPIIFTHWGNLDLIRVRPVNAPPGTPSVPVSTLVGNTVISVQVSAQ